jgi:hypothetical protein
MPVLAPVTLTDDSAASFTFAPVSSNGTTASLRTDAEVSRDLEQMLRISVTENKTRQRITMKLVKPVTSLDSAGNSVVTDEIFGQFEFMSPHTASDTDRAIVIQLCKSALDNALVKAVFENGEGIW